MKVFIAPHNDDEALFGSFTILREHPLVVIVYDSYVQFRRGDRITALQRRRESEHAMKILGAEVAFCGLSDECEDEHACSKVLAPYTAAREVWVPAFERHGHRQHNLIASIADGLFPDSHRYMTYTTVGKSRGVPVPIEPGWPAAKLAALACYKTQLDLARTRHFFLMDQYEYYLKR